MTNRCENFYNFNIEKYRKAFKLIESYLTPESIIFDVGSNIGMFSLPICEANKYNHIYLFEPSKELIEYSKYTTKGYDKLTFVNNGIGSCNEKKLLYKNTSDNIGWNSCYEKDPLQQNGLLPIHSMDKEEIAIITLDSFCADMNIDKIDFVKIDVEGMEFKVLEGFLSTLKKLDKKPYLYIEVGWGTSHPEWETVNSIYEKLFSIGYNRVKFTDKTEDILFTPI